MTDKTEDVLENVSEDDLGTIIENLDVVDLEGIVLKDNTDLLLQDEKLKNSKEFSSKYEEIIKNSKEEDIGSNILERTILEKQKLEAEIAELIQEKKINTKKKIIKDNLKIKKIPVFIYDNLLKIEDDEVLKTNIAELDLFIAKEVKKQLSEVLKTNKTKTIGTTTSKQEFSSDTKKIKFSDIFRGY